ncbi:MAG: HNH endonuclease [Caldilineaceae bacterium]|nr:HNH endonuclease [Caldilineaceae bacterium]HRJ45368.1 HNH endonuclease [Caldilineaceae bacterium]
MANRYISSELRCLVHERARNCCEYCYSQLGYSPDPFNVEHIHPRIQGGPTSPANLALACFGCNNAKGIETTAVDPLTEAIVPLYHPRQQRWDDHFRWNSDCTELIGVSATGRATIALLALNRPGLRQLRQILYRANEHPPAPINRG